MPAGTFLPPGLTTSDVKITSGGTNNYIMTAVDGETIQGEINLTFDGSMLTVAGDVTINSNDSGSQKLIMGDTNDTGIIEFLRNGPNYIDTKATAGSLIVRTGATPTKTVQFLSDQTTEFAGNIDLTDNEIRNVGASGHDWNATHLLHETDNEGGYSVISNKNTATETAANYAVTNVEVHTNSTADAYFSAGVSGVFGWNMGMDMSNSRAFAIGNATLGNNDAIRATNATPPVVTYNTTHPTGTFDYVCESCGTHQAELFNCCGVVEWHDDVMDFRAMALQDESAIDYMERVGVVERTTTNDGKPELFTKLGADFHFAMSAAFQNRQRMDAQNEAMDARLKRIEQALGV